ncbi:MAG: hypothetical protein ACREDR_29030 [Blastocatellia bacterium]
MPEPIIALYIGDELYPSAQSNIAITILTLQESTLTSPILCGVNHFENTDGLFYNGSDNPVFDCHGDYIGSPEWASIITSLSGGRNIEGIYLSFSTKALEFMSSKPTAAVKILSYVKNDLGFDGIDLDYEGGDYSTSSPIYPVAMRLSMPV